MIKKSGIFTPIALFAFNRPAHLNNTLHALASNELARQSSLTIFCDGPRTEQEEEKTNAVRKIAHAASGFSSLKVIEQEKNKGLASSVIAGVTFMLKQHERIIVLEDDLLTSPFFLRYMNSALEMYATSENVASIHGYLFPHNVLNPPETFFLRGTDCWGWGTWRRAWNVFEPDAEILLEKIRARHLFREFNVDGRFNYAAMLQGVAEGTVQSWAVRWHASAFLADMYTLHPGRSLVQHIGNDNSGTNFGTSNVLDVPLPSTPIEVSRIEVARHDVMYKAFRRFMGNMEELSITKRFKRHIKNFVDRSTVKSNIKKLTPPLLWDLAKKVVHRSSQISHREPSVSLWEGNYPSWSAACRESFGYDTDSIFEKVLSAAQNVREGKAIWERDSVCFFHAEYNFHLLSYLFYAAYRNAGELHILDFGGAFGSLYMQHRKILSEIKTLTWNIVEQEKIVSYGKKEFSNKELSFFSTLEEAYKQKPINCIILSGVLQYIEDPCALLKSILNFSPDTIYIGRTPMLEDTKRLCVQHVPSSIYRASYPCWFLNKKEISTLFSETYITTPWVQSPVDPENFFNMFAYKTQNTHS